MDYYVTESPDEYSRLQGLDFQSVSSATAGVSISDSTGRQALVLAGNPAQGEAYLHELAHIVVRGRGELFNEGVASWLGGSGNDTPHELYRRLRAYQRARPEITVEALLRWELPQYRPEDGFAYNASAALIMEGVFRRGGAAAVLALRELPPPSPALFVTLRAALGLPADDPTALERWWRRAAEEAAR